MSVLCALKDRRGPKRLLLALLFVTFTPTLSAADSLSLREARLKSGILYHITRFATWPSEIFSSPEEKLRVCVIAEKDDEVAGEIGNIFEDKRYKDERGIEVIILQNGKPKVADVRRCHLVYVGYVSEETFKDVTGQLSGKPVLVVKGALDREWQGAIIDLFQFKNKVRVRVYLELLKRSGLSISSELLNISEVVR